MAPSHNKHMCVCMGGWMDGWMYVGPSLSFAIFQHDKHNLPEAARCVSLPSPQLCVRPCSPVLWLDVTAASHPPGFLVMKWPRWLTNSRFDQIIYALWLWKDFSFICNTLFSFLQGGSKKMCIHALSRGICKLDPACARATPFIQQFLSGEYLSFLNF